MLKKLGIALVGIIAVLALTGVATAANKPTGNSVYLTSCPNPDKQVAYKTRVIVVVTKSGCVSIDKGATAVASGNAVVSAHGHSTVVASGHATVIVYNWDVRCSIKGPNVTVVDATTDWNGKANESCAPRG